MRERSTDAPVGRAGLKCSLVEGRPCVEVLYAIRSDRWDEGFATEIGAAAIDDARRDDRFDEIVAFTLLDNHASQAVMRKIGLAYDREIEHVGLPHVLHRAAV